MTNTPEARDIGIQVATLHNKQMDTGCWGTSEQRRLTDLLDRLGELVGEYTAGADWDAYVSGYDDTIDFGAHSFRDHRHG